MKELKVQHTRPPLDHQQGTADMRQKNSSDQWSEKGKFIYKFIVRKQNASIRDSLVTIHRKHYVPDPYNDQWEGLQDQFVVRFYKLLK